MTTLNKDRITSVIANNLTASKELVLLTREILEHHYSVDDEGNKRLYSEHIKQAVNELRPMPRLQKAFIAIINKTTQVRLVNAKDESGLKVNGSYLIAGKKVKGKLRELEAEVTNPNDLTPKQYNNELVGDDELWDVSSILDWGKEKKTDERSEAEKEAAKEFNTNINKFKKLVGDEDATNDTKLAALKALAESLGIEATIS